MLRSVKEMGRYSIFAADGADVGVLEEFYFDDASWKVRYLVVRAGGLLANRQVLVAPESVTEVDGSARCLRVNLGEEQLMGAPGIQADRPVAEQRELDYRERVGAATYWGSGWEAANSPAADTPNAVPEGGPDARRPLPGEGGDPHLRSTDRVKGHGISATDGEVGHVEDFIVEDGSWAVRYLVADTRDWLPGKKVLLPSARVSRADWHQREVHVDLTKDAVCSAPEWTAHTPMNRDYETEVRGHYDRALDQ